MPDTGLACYNLRIAFHLGREEAGTLSRESNFGHRQTEELVSPAMFFLSLAFLGLLAALMVLWIDVDRIVELTDQVSDAALGEATEIEFNLSPEALAKELEFEVTAHRWGNYCFVLLLLMWPLFPAEQLIRLYGSWILDSRERVSKFWWLFSLVPPLRLCAQQPGALLPNSELREPDFVWLPRLGWQEVNRQLQRRLERVFSVPMIGIALLILPILGLHFLFKEAIVDYPYLRVLLHFGTGLIWFAFAVEFIVMVSIAEKKLAYCKKHWLDLAIILLPLVSFLRTLRLLRAGKLIKIGKLQQLSRVVRVYRLRGVAMRLLRAMMVLEVIHRLIRTKPESRIQKLEHQYREKEHELLELREKIDLIKLSLDEAARDQSPRTDAVISATELED